MAILLPDDAFSQGDAARLGVGSRTLYRLLEKGQIERIGRGLYRRADLAPVDFDYIEIAHRRPDATICLVSALAQHDLVDAIPSWIDIALPRGQRGATTRAPVEWHLFDRDSFDIGRTLMSTGNGDQSIGIYSAERSIVDSFRMRDRTGYEIGTEALRLWLRRGGSPAHLYGIAKQLPRATGPVRTALEYLA